MSGETVVGSVLGYLRLDADQFNREVDKAIAKIELLEHQDVNVKVKADTAGAEAKLAAVGASGRIAAGGLDSLTAASRRLQDATGKVGVAQLRLSELQDSGKARASQIVAAEQNLRRAREAETDAIWRTYDANIHLGDSGDKVDESNRKVAKSSRDAGRGMGALATAIITLGPALVPLAAGAVGAGVALGAMGAAGILAIVGIKREMEAGSAVGRAYTGQVAILKGNLSTLARTAATGVLAPFTDSVHDLQSRMPQLNKIIGEFSGITGRTAGAFTSGLLAAFVAFEPLARDVGVYLLTLGQRFAALMSGGGVTTFGDYVRSVFPQVMASVEAIVGAVIHLVAAFAPLGGGILAAVTAFSAVIGAIPVHVLSTTATLAAAVFLGFKGYSALAAGITALSGGLQRLGVAATIAASGVRALNIAAGAIGVILTVAAVLFAHHAESVRENQQAVNSFTDALIQSNGALDVNIRQMTAKALADQGVLANARLLGLSLSDVMDAALGQADAMARIDAQLAATKAGMLGNAFANQAAANSYQETSAEISSVTKALHGSAGVTSEATQKWKDLQAATAGGANANTAAAQSQAALAAGLGASLPAMQAAATAQQQQANSAAQATVKMQMENDAAGILKQSLDLLNGETLSAADAQNAFDSSLTNMGTHANKSGKQVTFTTTSIRNMSAASVALRGQLNSQVANLQRVVEANGGLANSTGKARAQMVTMRKQIIDNAVAHGIDRKAVTAYIDSLLKIPKKVPPTKFDVDTANARAKVSQLQALINAVHGKSVSVVINTYNKQKANPDMLNSANGNILHAYAGGGLENHVAQIATAGSMRLWAEPETGGEAYIPLAPSKRARSQAILAEVNREFGNTSGGQSIDYEALARALARELRAAPIVTTVSAGATERSLMAGSRC